MTLAKETVKLEQEFGFLYDPQNGVGKDLSGFEDGISNPKTLEARLSYAIVAADADRCDQWPYHDYFLLYSLCPDWPLILKQSLRWRLVYLSPEVGA